VREEDLRVVLIAVRRYAIRIFARISCRESRAARMEKALGRLAQVAADRLGVSARAEDKA
jgi:hypothetical protein